MEELPQWKIALWVALGGALGALGRYFTTVGITHWLGKAWPFGTLTVNLLGCVVLGLMAGLDLANEGLIHPALKALVMVGFLGAFTTFSTFSLEGARLLRESPSMTPGLLYMGLSVVLGLALAWLSLRLGLNLGSQGA